MKRSGVLLFASVQAIGLSSIAHAQDAVPVPAQTSASAGDDIVVTARRREEALQDVPISITAVSGSKLVQAGVTDIGSLQAVAPALNVTTSGTARNVFSLSLRGQRTNESQLLTDAPVGAYFAEVLQARTVGFGFSLYDLQSVQVLKGVQGTLFGRNMTGGAVLVEPNRPTDKVEGELRGQIGNYRLRDLYGMINLPLADWAALRVAGKVRERKGFTTDISDGRDYDDQNFDSFRVSLLLNPGNLESITVFDWVRSKTHGSALYPTAIDPTAPAIAGYATLRGFGFPVANPVAQFARQQTFRRQQIDQGLGDGGTLDAYGQKPSEYIKNYGISNRTSIPIGDLTLKNIFGYRKLTSDILQDLDGVPAVLIQSDQIKRIQQYSEELQLQGNALDNKLTFVLGGYYFLEKGFDGSTSQQFPELAIIGSGLPLSTPAILFRNQLGGTGRAEAVAGYLAGTYRFTDQLQLSAGLRYTDDKRRATVSPSLPGLGVCLFRDARGTPLPFGSCSRTNSRSWNALTWDVTLQYQPTEELTAYVSTRKGFRAGGFSLRATSDAELAPFNPEKVQEYEVGLKNRFNLGSATLSTALALYYQDYKDVQKQTSGIDAAGNVTTIIENTAAQKNYGGEFDATLTSGPFSLTLAYAYVNVDITKGRQQFEYELVGASKHQLGLNANYGTAIPDVGDLSLNAGLAYRSGVWLDKNDEQGRQKAYALINLRAGIDNIGGTGLGVAAFANNVTNQWYRIGVIGIYREAGYIASTYGEPRTYGMEVSYKF